MGIFSSKPKWQTPPRVPTDTVIPLNPSDDTPVLRSVCLVISYRIDDVLDPEELRDGLERLVDRDGWRKMGGRLRLNEQGKLEYHIPAKFDREGRPAIHYSQEEYSISINEHKLASKMPRASQKPAVVANPEEFLPLARSQGQPKDIDDYLYRDEPQLALHIVSFTDATIVSISLPHTLTDGTGGGHIYHAWSLALQGRDNEIAPFHGFGYDPLDRFGSQAKEPYLYRDRLLAGWRTWAFILRSMWEGWWYRTESRVVCIPKDYLARLRQSCAEEIRKTTGNEKAFVSDNDVLCAWFSRLAIADFSPKSTRTIRIMNAFSLASVVTDRLPSAKAFISNAATEMYAFVPACDLLTKPLSYTAWAVRRSMMEGGTYEQVEALQAIKNESSETGQPGGAIFGDVSMECITFSNWTKGKFFETDFSSAVVKEGRPRSERAEAPGIPSYLQFHAWSTTFQLRNIFPIMGKDAAGNYWLEGPLRKGVWDVIEKKLEVEAASS